MKARPKGLHPDCELVIQWSREKGITLKNVTDNAVLKKEKTNLFPTQDAKRWAQHKREKDKKRKKPIKLPDGYDPRHSLLEPHEKLNTPTSTMPKKDGVDDATKAFGKLGLENKYDKVTTLHEDNAKNLPHHTSFKTIPNVLSREGDHRVQAASVKLPVLQVNQRIYDGEFRLAKEGAGQGIISSEYFDLRTLGGLNGKDEGMANLQFGPEQQRLELHNQEIYKHVKKSGGPDKEESFWSQVRQFYRFPALSMGGRSSIPTRSTTSKWKSASELMASPKLKLSVPRLMTRFSSLLSVLRRMKLTSTSQVMKMKMRRWMTPRRRRRRSSGSRTSSTVPRPPQHSSSLSSSPMIVIRIS